MWVDEQCNRAAGASAPSLEKVRLDNFLRWSRLVQRRALVKQMCDGGAIAVNDVVAKPGKVVKAGDIISLRFWDKVLRVEVLAVAERAVPRKVAPSLYRVVREEKVSVYAF